jgi:hypothetical protein
MGTITKSVTLPQAEKACQGQTLKLVGPIHKLRIKQSVVNTTTGAILATLNFSHNLLMGPITLSVTLLQAEKARQVQTLKLVDRIHKLSFVNATPDNKT